METLRARRRPYLTNRLSRLELGSSKSGLLGDDSSILISRTSIATEWPVMNLSVQALWQGTKKRLAVPAHGQQTKRLGYGPTSITCAVERATTVRLTALQHSFSPFCFKPRYCMRTTVYCQARLVSGGVQDFGGRGQRSVLDKGGNLSPQRRNPCKYASFPLS